MLTKARIRCDNCGKERVEHRVDDDTIGLPVECVFCNQEHIYRPIIGGYFIERHLGGGTFGAVYLAVDGALNKKVALKFPKLRDQGYLRRFRTEARVAANIIHEHVCEVFRIDVHDSGSKDKSEPIPYIVMKYVEGKNLRQCVEAERPLPYEKILDWACAIADAMTVSHGLGFFHRDLKSLNILIDIHDKPYVTDFGLARDESQLASRESSDGRALGTPEYMPREAFEGRLDADYAKMDVYSMGIMLFEMITGDVPYKGSPLTILRLLQSSPIPRASERRPDVDPELDKICFKAMQHDLEKRYQSMKELLEDLKKVQARGVATRDGTPADLGSPPSVSTPTPTLVTKPIKLLGMKFAVIPAGEFLMGSDDSDPDAYSNEKPKHPVKISRSFLLGVYPVTQEEYVKVVGENPSDFKGPMNPVDTVSWFDAARFCNLLSEREGFTPFYHIKGSRARPKVSVPDRRGVGYRLPSEAEWEYACRGGTTTRYFFGDDPALLSRYAWFGDNSGREPLETAKIWGEHKNWDKYWAVLAENECATHPVGEKEPNPFKLCDVLGNVLEWCEDWYADKHVKSKYLDPINEEADTFRVLRGGSFYFYPRVLRCANRDRLEPSDRDRYIGFRVSRTYD